MKHRIIWLLILIAPLCVGWTDTLRTDTPAGGDDPREADDRMREIKAAFVERLGIDHCFEASATSVYDAADTGMHRYVTYQAPISTPATIAASQARTYTKDVSNKAEFHWIDEDENEIQLTSGGEILFSSLGSVANNTYITAVDAAGTGTANLIKADANDVAVLPDSSKLATSAAPTANSDIANKKYVDDTVQDGDYVAKAWGYITHPTTVTAHKNISGATNPSTGKYVVSWDTDFASGNYAVLITPVNATLRVVSIESQAAGSVTVEFYNSSHSLSALTAFHIVAFGTQ